MLPAVTGTPTQGQTLSASPGVWTSSTTVSYGYQWTRCGYRASVLSDSPLGYWRLGESSGSLAKDETGLADGTYAGSGVTLGVPGVVSGDSNSAARFDGISGSMSASVGSNPNTFTAEAWFRPASVSTADNSAVMGKAFSGTGSYWAVTYQGGKLALIVADTTAASGRRTISGATSVSDPTKWYLVDATFDGSTAKLYLNGVLDGSGTVGALYNPGNYPLSVGVANERGYFAGSVDDVSYFGSALSQTRIQAHYNSAVCSNISGATTSSYTPRTNHSPTANSYSRAPPPALPPQTSTPR